MSSVCECCSSYIVVHMHAAGISWECGGVGADSGLSRWPHTLSFHFLLGRNRPFWPPAGIPAPLVPWFWRPQDSWSSEHAMQVESFVISFGSRAPCIDNSAPLPPNLEVVFEQIFVVAQILQLADHFFINLCRLGLGFDFSYQVIGTCPLAANLRHGKEQIKEESKCHGKTFRW